MPLPQQPARRTPQRRRNNDPKTKKIRATVTMCIHQEVLNSQLVHRPQREQLRRLPRPSRGDPSARSERLACLRTHWRQRYPYCADRVHSARLCSSTVFVPGMCTTKNLHKVDNTKTASPQLDEPTWPLILLMVCETEPEEADDDVNRGTL